MKISLTFSFYISQPMSKSYFCALSFYSIGEIKLLDGLAKQVTLAIASALKRRKNNFAMRKAARRKPKWQIKAKFLAVFSHELRTPLNPILNLTRLLGGRIALFLKVVGK
jgi:signal transduction histidine kinase